MSSLTLNVLANTVFSQLIPVGLVSRDNQLAPDLPRPSLPAFALRQTRLLIDLAAVFAGGGLSKHKSGPRNTTAGPGVR